MLSNRADSFFCSLVGVWSSLIVLSPHENRAWCFSWDTHPCDQQCLILQLLLPYTVGTGLQHFSLHYWQSWNFLIHYIAGESIFIASLINAKTVIWAKLPIKLVFFAIIKKKEDFSWFFAKILVQSICLNYANKKLTPLKALKSW
jgi:hypothetical protein